MIVLNLLIGMLLYPSGNPTATFGMAADSWALALVIFLIPYLTRGKALWAHSGIAFLGRISYSIYLMHPVVLYGLTRTTLDGFVLIGTTFVVTIAISIVTYRYIELPPIRFGHNLRAIKLSRMQQFRASN